MYSTDLTGSSRPVTVYLAIDYGTTRSAVALCQGTDIEYYNAWEEKPQGASLFKAPTVSLYGPDKKLKSIAHKVKVDFADLSIEERKRHTIIRKPKMNLTKTELDGIPMLSIVADYLNELRGFGLSQVERRVNVDSAGIRKKWALTVPAIWTDGDKNLMRRAAVKANIIPHEDSEDLILILEPEGAVATFVEYARKEWKMERNQLVGQVVLVVDAGGGTIDITLHKIVKDGLSEMCAGTGNRYGADCINDKILEELQGHFSSPLNEELSGLQMNKLLYTIEEMKCLLKEYRERSIEIPYKLKKTLNEGVNSIYSRIQYDEEEETLSFVLTAEGFRQFFFESIVETQKLVEDRIKRVQSIGETVDYVWLVGGFSNSPVFQGAIKEVCGGLIKVYTPHDAEAAIVRGAVIIAQNPDIFVDGRYQRQTLSILETVLWDEREHKGQSFLESNGNKYCNTVLRTITEKETKVGLNEPVRVNVVTVPGQRVACLMFCDNPSNHRFFNKDVQLMGLMKIIVPPSDIQTEIAVDIFLGKTERKATAHLTNMPERKFSAKLENIVKLPPYHFIFVIDYSESMENEDIQPTDFLFRFFNKNRLGAVFEAVTKFINIRLESNKTNDEICSLIKFNHIASTVFENQAVSTELKKYLNFFPERNTSFVSALNEVNRVLESVGNCTPMVIFLSDGEEWEREKIVEKVNQMVNANPSLVFNTICIGGDCDTSLLQEMAKIGNGLFFETGKSATDLMEVYEVMASTVIVL